MAGATLAFQQSLAGTKLRVGAAAPVSKRHVAAPRVTCLAAKQQSSEASVPAEAPAPSTQAKTKGHSHSGLIKPTRRRLIMGGVTAGMMAAVGCPLCDQNLSLANAAEWGYGDLSGPSEWGDVCKTGAAQSPIDLPTPGKGSPVLVKDNSPGAIKFNFALAAASYLNTGHGTMQVNFPAGTNGCRIGDRKLELLQYHFHAPSEHSFNGVRTAMEVHLVHRDTEGKLAVVGVMLEAGAKVQRNLCVEAALAFAPDEKYLQIGAPVQCYDVPLTSDGDSVDSFSLQPKTRKQCIKIQISPKPLLPKPDRPDGTHSYIHYKGSLTTPPCSEGVDWFVLLSPLTIPDAQVVEFMRFVGDRKTIALNSRPRQDLGERQLFLGPTTA